MQFVFINIVIIQYFAEILVFFKYCFFFFSMLVTCDLMGDRTLHPAQCLRGKWPPVEV